MGHYNTQPWVSEDTWSSLIHKKPTSEQLPRLNTLKVNSTEICHIISSVKFSLDVHNTLNFHPWNKDSPSHIVPGTHTNNIAFK